MEIESPNRAYRILQRLMSEPQEEIFLCKESGKEEQKQYLVIEVRDSVLAYSVIPMFLSWHGEEGFQDYIECFNYQGMLYLVFLHDTVKSLEEQMQKKQFLLSERLLVIKGILSNAILQSLPTPILWEILQYQNILVADDLTVHFEYTLLMLDVYSGITFHDIQERLGNLLKAMFEEELEERSLPELAKFIQALEGERYEKLIDLYHDYNELCSSLLIKVKEGRVKPQRIWFQIWETVKVIAGRIKSYVIALVVIILAFYLIHTLVNHTNDATEKTVFHYIGNITIDTQE